MEARKPRAVIHIAALAAALMLVWGLQSCGARAFQLRLPDPEDVTGIVLTTDSGEKAEAAGEELDGLMRILTASGKGREARKESVQDAPLDADGWIKVEFDPDEAGAWTVFVYGRKGRFYLEQPYNGIYPITLDDYGAFEKYFW